MAIQAAVDSVIFLGVANPGHFTMTANVQYFDEVGNSPFAGINVDLPIGIDSSGVNETLINEVIRLAPEGFEVTETEILIPVYSSGSPPGLTE